MAAPVASNPCTLEFYLAFTKAEIEVKGRANNIHRKVLPISAPACAMLNNEPNVQVSDTTKF